MKYLKRINEHNNEAINDIKEILLEVNDVGYTFSIMNQYSNVAIMGDSQMIYIYNDGRHLGLTDIKHQTIRFELIKDCLLRIKDYLGKNYDSFCYRNMVGEELFYTELNEDTELNWISTVTIITKHKI